MTRHILAAFTLVAATVLGASTATAQELRLDPAKVVGPTACGDCHEASIAAWRDTHHFSTFKNMPRTDEARSIADKMGIKRIKAEGDYEAAGALLEQYGIHFDPDLRDEVVKRVAGVNLASYTGFVMPKLEAVTDDDGEIVEIRISYPRDLTQQMLEYSGKL